MNALCEYLDLDFNLPEVFPGKEGMYFDKEHSSSDQNLEKHSFPTSFCAESCIYKAKLCPTSPKSDFGIDCCGDDDKCFVSKGSSPRPFAIMEATES